MPSQEFEAKQLLWDICTDNANQQNFYMHIRRYTTSGLSLSAPTTHSISADLFHQSGDDIYIRPTNSTMGDTTPTRTLFSKRLD